MEEKLFIVPVPTDGVDRAWENGASNLAKACENEGSFVTPEVLKYMLLRGDKHLFAVVKEGSNDAVGWFVASVVNYPLFKSFLIYSAYGPGALNKNIVEQAKVIAQNAGCTKIECATSVQKLKDRYKELGLKEVFTTLMVDI